MTVEHACIECRGTPGFPIVQVHEGHGAVRFGDRNGRLRVIFEGVDVTHRAWEAIAGTPGRVGLFCSQNGKPHVCPLCHKSACSDILEGDVQVVAVIGSPR